MFVAKMFCISTLHCKLGITNRLSSELENRCPDYLNFCKSIGMVKDPYNNKDYSGRYCDKLLKNLDKLDDVVGEELAPFVATLKAFSKVIHACFGKEADPNYREIISDFENCWFDIFIEFDIAFTNKAHIIISHVPQVIARTGRGLFYQSEEVVEQPTQNLKLSGRGTKSWMLRVNSMVKVCWNVF